MRCFLLCLCACGDQGPAATAETRVRVVDASDRPLPGAVVWTLPAERMERRSWMPIELAPYCGNPHELLRRLGTRQVADASGLVRVPRGSCIAGESGELAGVTTVDAVESAPHVLTLDAWRWTICVHDATGTPVPGVPVSCDVAMERRIDEFEGQPLGLTDGEGRLVVRAPGSVYVRNEDQGEIVVVPGEVSGAKDHPLPVAPTFVAFEVDGMYLAPHAQSLSLEPGRSGSVTLTLPSVTKVELRVPEWNGPIADAVSLTRAFHGMPWDNTCGLWEEGRLFALVGTERSGPTAVRAVVEGTTIATTATVPHLPPGEVFVIELRLDRGDIIVRARIVDAAGRPASRAVFSVKPVADRVRSRHVRADDEGDIAVVLGGEGGGAIELEFEVHDAPDRAWDGARAKLRCEGLRPEERRDAGSLTLTRR